MGYTTQFDSLRSTMSRIVLACCIGHFALGLIALSGNITLFQATLSLREFGPEGFPLENFNLPFAWWSIALANFFFAIFNTLSALVFCGFVFLYNKGDWRLIAAGLIQLMWTPLALVADTGVAGTAWVNGIQSGAGFDPAQLVSAYSVMQEQSFNVFRWVARGYYLLIGLSMFIVAVVGFNRGWPKSFSGAALLLGIALWLEVLTFAITLIYGSSPIQIPAYLLNFTIATPFWELMMWLHLRRNTLETNQ